MEYAITLLIGIAIGYFMHWAASKPRTAAKEDPTEVMVKRTRLSMRSPLKTSRTEYDKYKTRDSGLYAPVKPKLTNNDQIEVGR